jgi:hypothetical protein
MEARTSWGYSDGMNISKRVQFLAVVIGACVLAFPGTAVLAGVDGVDPGTGHLWTQIKDDTYSQKDAFSKGVDVMSSKLNDEIGALKAKRSAMTGDTDEWDFSMKEVDCSRALLTGRIEALSKAMTPETWEDAKTKVGEAWTRSQLAVDAMNATRTT